MHSNIEIIQDVILYKDLFNRFNSVYIFGSVLSAKPEPNDLDLLLVYKALSDSLPKEIDCIQKILESVCGVPIDITALSENELSDTKFLERVKKFYQIK